MKYMAIIPAFLLFFVPFQASSSEELYLLQKKESLQREQREAERKHKEYERKVERLEKERSEIIRDGQETIRELKMSIYDELPMEEKEELMGVVRSKPQRCTPQTSFVIIHPDGSFSVTDETPEWISLDTEINPDN